MFRVELIVRPKSGVRDPQGDAVEESLRSLSYDGFQARHVKVHHVGRVLSLDLDAKSEADARRIVDEMCKRLLVNPNLETYSIDIKGT